MPLLVAMAFAVVLSASSARAQPGELETCGESGVTIEIVQCLQKRTIAWDRRLNAAYQKRLGSLAGRQRELLQAAQRLWVHYRDANCSFYAAGEGTISRVEAADCLRTMTETRARELEGEEH